MTVKELSDLLAKLPPDMPIALNGKDSNFLHNIGLRVVTLYDEYGEVQQWYEGNMLGKPKPENAFDACLIEFEWVQYHGDSNAVVLERTIQRIDDYLNAGATK